MLEFFVFIIIVLLVILLIMVSFHKANLAEKITMVDKKLNVIYKEVMLLKQDGVKTEAKSNVVKEEVIASKKEIKPSTPKAPSTVIEKTLDRSRQSVEPTVKEEPEIIEPVKDSAPIVEEKIAKEPIEEEEKAVPAKEEIIKEEPELVVLPNPMDKSSEEPVKPPVDLTAKVEKRITEKPKQTPFEETKGFESKQPNLKKEPAKNIEQQIGENWLSRIGIAILIVGIGYSVKYAIDNNWINEVGRVLIGLISGGILLGVAYFLRKSYKAFSSVLAGGAIATFYYTITIAYQYYGMFSQTTGFGIMLVITAFGVFLSLKFNRLELAAIALVGGFTSPFMVSNGGGDYVTFFTYIAILNVGMLVLAYYKKWTLITGLAISFTFILMGFWVVDEFVFHYGTVASKKVHAGIIFSTIFYIIFYASSLLYTLKREQKFDVLDFITLLGTTIFYLVIGMTVLSANGFDKYQGLFVAGLGVFNLLIALFVKSHPKIDKNLYFLIVAKAVVVISIFAPVQLYGNYISVFWLSEVVALIWISQQTKMSLFKHISAGVFIFALLSLLINWVSYYVIGSGVHIPFGNKAFAASMFALVTFIGSIYLLSKEEENNSYLFMSPSGFSSFVKVCFGLVIYATFLFELNAVTDSYNYGRASLAITTLLNFGYHFVLLTAALVMFRNNTNDVVKTLGLVFMSFLVLLYLVFGNMSVITIRNGGLAGAIPLFWFMLHYIIIGCIVTSIWVFYNSYIKGVSKKDSLRTMFYIFLALIVLIISSVELDHLGVLLFSAQSSSYQIMSLYVAKVVAVTHKAGYTVLWAICSFVFMYMGMKNKIQAMRIISLLLFLVVILKLFLFDLYNLSELARIISFIGLGVILLVVSFMYQRLKKLIVEGE